VIVEVLLALHLATPVEPHGCHLTAAARWSEALVVDYMQTDALGARLVARTPDGCLCVVRVDHALLQTQTVISAGREFIGAGGLLKGELMLERVCDTFAECSE